MDVLVAGGGIGGLASACALATSGRSVRVLERAPRFAEVLDEVFTRRYGAPYVVIHRTDPLDILVRACVRAGVGLVANRTVEDVVTVGGTAVVRTAAGEHRAHVAVAADGPHSRLRAHLSADEPVCSVAARRSGAARTAMAQTRARTWGEIWHVDGLSRLLRNELFRDRRVDDFRHVDWLYG